MPSDEPGEQKQAPPMGLPPSDARRQTQSLTRLLDNLADMAELGVKVLGELLDNLADMAELGVKVLGELWAQVQEEKAEEQRQARQAQAGPAKSRSGF